MNPVFLKEPGKVILMMGNEAIARGAIEAGVDFTASYPGSPSSEIQETLSKAAPIFGHHAEWSVNEKVAFEACCGASFAGMRALTAMKQNGVNVVSDVLNTVNLSGTKGGIVLVVADDPGGHSSTNEMDSRLHAKLAELPLLEPSSPEEAKEMVKYAFELSERIKLPVLMRSVTQDFPRARRCQARRDPGPHPQAGHGLPGPLRRPPHSPPGPAYACEPDESGI